MSVILAVCPERKSEFDIFSSLSGFHFFFFFFFLRSAIFQLSAKNAEQRQSLNIHLS